MLQMSIMPIEVGGIHFDTVKSCLSERERIELDLLSRPNFAIYYMGEDIPWESRLNNQFIPGQHLGFRFRIESETPLSFGAHAFVYRGRDMKTDQDVAIKIVRPHNADALKFTEREYDVMSEVRNDPSHPGYHRLLHAIDAFKSRFGFAVIYPLMSGDLLEYLNERDVRWDVSMIRKIAWSVLEAIACLHAKEVAHCDIKPDNIMVCPSQPSASNNDCLEVKLGDFGFVTKYGQLRQGATKQYAPPEIAYLVRGARRELFISSRRNFIDGTDGDIFSLGATLLSICSGGHFDMIQHYLQDIPRSITMANRVAYGAILLSEDGKLLAQNDPAQLEDLAKFIAGLIVGNQPFRFSLNDAFSHRFLNPPTSLPISGSSDSVATAFGDTEMLGNE